MTRGARTFEVEEWEGLHQFCEAEGVKISTMVPYHPASNGITECTIRVLTSSVRTMLTDSGLPKSLWAEAFNTVTYVRNSMLTRVLDGRTPYDMVYGVKPNLADLCAFSTPCAIVELVWNWRNLMTRRRWEGIGDGICASWWWLRLDVTCFEPRIGAHVGRIMWQKDKHGQSGVSTVQTKRPMHSTVLWYMRTLQACAG